jgi:hypothetical protein
MKFESQSSHIINTSKLLSSHGMLKMKMCHIHYDILSTDYNAVQFLKVDITHLRSLP